MGTVRRVFSTLSISRSAQALWQSLMRVGTKTERRDSHTTKSALCGAPAVDVVLWIFVPLITETRHRGERRMKIGNLVTGCQAGGHRAKGLIWV
jgi:hypothetical protein